VTASLAVTPHSERDDPPPTLHCERDVPPGGGRARLVLVHGFGQTGRCWGPVAADLARDHELVRVDAPGHAGSSGVRADLPTTARLLAELVQPGEPGEPGEPGGRAVYVGYSMGGRMALHVALDRPEVVQALVLVGATPGIEDGTERAERRERDHRLAQRLRAGGDAGLGAFVAGWLDQPMFAGLPAWARFEDERRRNTAEGLATSLELAGTGSQVPRWADLHRIDVPVLLVTGAGDARYTGIATRMAERIGARASLAAIPGAGHAAHLEQPEAFLAALRPWLAGLGGLARRHPP
jgi:2-succinyl-6-hydroxy-2,4-cyclohexadiene-1-carboxylate synthase